MSGVGSPSLRLYPRPSRAGSSAAAVTAAAPVSSLPSGVWQATDGTTISGDSATIRVPAASPTAAAVNVVPRSIPTAYRTTPP
jgi:hypothetical protein